MDAAKFLIEFDDLEFEDELDKGNFGKVSVGYYLGTKVAIKELFFVDDEFMEKYIEREMQTLIQLSHPNIIQLIGLCVTTDVFLVTEFVEGGNLRTSLSDARDKLPWTLRCQLSIQCARALVYLHEKHNLMHRDLKSSNILIDKSGKDWVAKVCDFGLAREDTNQSAEFKASVAQLYTVVGTSEWMAPEVALGQEYNKAADVFSFGIVLWEVATRLRPPVRKPPLFKLDTDLFESQLPRDIPAGFWDVIVGCTQKYDDQRLKMGQVLDKLMELEKKVIEAAEKNPPPAEISTPKEEPKKVSKAAAPAEKPAEKKDTPSQQRKTSKKEDKKEADHTASKKKKDNNKKNDTKKKNEEKENKTEEDVAEGEASNPISEWEKKKRWRVPGLIPVPRRNRHRI